ncbi:uncharacterized protein C1orf198 homolog [Aplochiton taeniatus]
MAAATMAGLDAHRMEEKKLAYFSSINSMASKIMQERQQIKERHGSAWDKMTQTEQDSAIDNGMMDPQIRARYAMHRVEREEVVCYPKLLIQTGQKIVHFGDEDITWQDEHSSPFSWETKSQLEFSLSGASEQGVPSSISDSKPTKPPQAGALSKGTSGGKVSNGDGPGLGRRAEEESSFWKISVERSRLLDGEQADFHSLTPSQIKSLEKGEKPLPSYLRPDTSISSSPSPAPTPPREHEADPPLPAPTRSSKHRATPRPPAPPPPVPVAVTAPVAISITPSPAPVSVSSSVAGWERSQSTLPSVSNAPDDVFAPSLSPAATAKTPSRGGGPEKEQPTALATSPTFSQFNTSSNLLKTGFDFLDNW